MQIPAVTMSFSKEDEEWEYGYTTIDLLILFYIVPERSRNPTLAIEQWNDLKMTELCEQFQEGKADLDVGQCYLFLDATHALLKWFESGDRPFLEKVYSMVRLRTDQFASADAFYDYYVYHANSVLDGTRKYFSQYPEALAWYERLFMRWKANYTYAKWRSLHVQQYGKS